MIPISSERLPLLLLLLTHLGIMLLESFAEALRQGHVFLDAARDAARLAARERLGGEVVDAGHEAVVD
jgi:hypothetical protein